MGVALSAFAIALNREKAKAGGIDELAFISHTRLSQRNPLRKSHYIEIYV